MSLIAWWPLSGDIKDKIGNITQMGSTDITSTTGKIGSGYYFNGSTSEVVGILNTNMVTRINSGTVSVAMWVKLDTTSSGWDQLLTIGNRGTGWNDIRIGLDLSTGEGLKFSVSNGTNYSGRVCGTNAIHDGLWHHLVGTSSNGTIKLYVDGLLKSEESDQPIPQVTTSQYVCIGGSADERGQGCLQDVKIYDHVLSLKEIKELSKALVCHYSFEESSLTPNIFDTATFLKDTANRCTVVPYGSNGFTMTSTGNDPYIGTSVNSGNGVGALSTWYVGSANSQVCLSWKHVSGPELNKSYMTFLNSSGQSLNTSHNNFGDYIISNGDQRYVLQTLPAGTVKVHIRFGNGSLASGNSITVDNICLKIGNNTLYSPYAVSNRLVNNTGLVQPSDVINIFTSSDAGIGKQSLECKGSTIINARITGDISEGATASCWIKVPTYPTANAIVFTDSNSKLAFGFYGTANAIISCNGYSTQYVLNINNEWLDGWNHVVVTRTPDSIISCYLNGVKLNTSGSNNWSSSTGYSTIGGRHNGSYQTYFNGLVDDFRLYHTILSADDIQELYNSRWSANSQGQVFSSTVNENQSKFQITKSGINNCNTLNESGNLPSGYIPLQYLQSSGTQYINTNHLATANTRTIFDYEYLNASASWAGLFGSDNNPTNNNMGYGLFLNGSTYSCYVSSHTTGSCWNQQVGTWTQNQRTLLDFTHKKLIINNVAYNLKTTVFDTSLVPMYLFVFRRSAGNAGVSSIRLYSCQIWEGTTLVRNFIPAKRATDGVLGLYDTANNTFYTNVGSNDFIAGPAAISQGRNGNFYVGEFNEI